MRVKEVYQPNHPKRKEQERDGRGREIGRSQNLFLNNKKKKMIPIKKGKSPKLERIGIGRTKEIKGEEDINLSRDLKQKILCLEVVLYSKIMI